MWSQLFTAALGIWLMAAPAVIGYAGAARTSDRIVGPIVVTFAWIAGAECTRGLRRANLPLAVWLVVAPLLLGHGMPAALNSVAAGAAVALLSLRGGVTRARFGGGWRTLWRSGEVH